jgi:muramoyltetrapeptide carboxypeptidase
MDNLKMLGFEVVPGAALFARHGHLAGKDEERLSDLHWAFSDPSIDGVWCVRGGYGCTRLLDRIDFSLIKRHPKVFVGYSDITALHLSIFQKTGMHTFHGPVAASDYPEFTVSHLRAAISGGDFTQQVIESGAGSSVKDAAFQPAVIAPGRAEGRLMGGNLCLLAALAGTAYLPDLKGKLVFLEEIGERPYRLDRMLTQLLTATRLREAAGIALGVFTDCQSEEGSASMSMMETLQDRLGNLGIPVCYGLPFGHIAAMATLPLGIRAVLDADRGSLRFLESAVR